MEKTESCYQCGKAIVLARRANTTPFYIDPGTAYTGHYRSCPNFNSYTQSRQFTSSLPLGDIEYYRPPAGPVCPTALPEDAAARKKFPVASGVLSYFPKALVAIAHVSYVGNEQHNPGEPLHWDRSKSTDEADALIRHFLARGTKDADGLAHSAKCAWRALALLEKEIENEQKEI